MRYNPFESAYNLFTENILRNAEKHMQNAKAGTTAYIRKYNFLVLCSTITC